VTPATSLDLESAVARILDDSDLADVVELERETLDYDAFLAGRTLVRVRGTARLGAGTVPWSFIEKCTEGPSLAPAYLYDNARREFSAYRSGLLDDLAPGITAPALLAADEGADGRLTLWIEDLSGGPRAPLSREEVLLAAQHLGRLSGRWLERVPAHEWLFGGWIDRHSQPQAIPDGLATVIAAQAHPEIEARLGGRLGEAADLIAAQDEYADALRRLPKTLCHHDAVAANVFARDASGEHETVLIDWESVGPGPVGADLASLLFASPRRGDFSARGIKSLIGDALAAYSDGLAEAGASVEPEQVRLGLCASIALRWALVRDLIGVLHGTNGARRGSAPHETPSQALAELLMLVPVLLDSAADAKRLMSRG
jgi:hypothetical protein